MMHWAHIDMVASEIGLHHFGGTQAFYDQPMPEQSEALAVAMARSEAPELGQGPVTYQSLVKLWNDSRPKKRKSTSTSVEELLEQQGV